MAEDRVRGDDIAEPRAPAGHGARSAADGSRLSSGMTQPVTSTDLRDLC